MMREYSDERLEEICSRVEGWYELFSRSVHFERLTQEQKRESGFVVMSFAEYMYSYHLLSPEEWDGDSVEDCCINILPRKITADKSFYYSDPHSDIPVREVTRVDDNKADPNLETMTFGLFSTCERGMRTGIVNRGMELIFFCTNRAGVRVLTGYYKIGWYYKGPPIKGYSKHVSQLDDYILAAKEGKFVAPGFPLRDLTNYLKGKKIDSRFRTFRYINGEIPIRLLYLLKDTPDATLQYLSEIHRLEQLNLKRHGYVYPVRKMRTGFSWDIAPRYMGIKE